MSVVSAITYNMCNDDDQDDDDEDEPDVFSCSDNFSGEKEPLRPKAPLPPRPKRNLVCISIILCTFFFCNRSDLLSQRKVGLPRAHQTIQIYYSVPALHTHTHVSKCIL